MTRETECRRVLAAHARARRLSLIPYLGVMAFLFTLVAWRW
jgi:hypothetical protein